MLLTPYFVYLHHPKTGGTFVTKMLHELQARHPGFKVVEPPGLKHSGRGKIPSDYAHLPVVTNIRYLLDHYVSRYEFRWWTRPGFFRPEIRKDYPEFPDLDFKTFMQVFCNWHYRDIEQSKADRWVRHHIGVNTRAITRIVGINNSEILALQDQLEDADLREKFEGVHVLKSHRLNQDLVELIRSCGKQDGVEYDTDFILESQKVLPKLGGRGDSGKDWRNYFDDELLDFVMLRDRLLLRSLPWLLEEFPEEAKRRFPDILRRCREDSTAMKEVN